MRHNITRDDNIKDTRNKIILREIAKKINMPDEIYCASSFHAS